MIENLRMLETVIELYQLAIAKISNLRLHHQKSIATGNCLNCRNVAAFIPIFVLQANN
jgi:hypothetical protein